MSWLKVDDQFPDHPKALALGRDRLAAIGLWTIGSCYAARFLTDGFIPASALPSGSRRLAGRLVEVGLWDEAPGGYRIHDYHDYQPSREAVIKVRRDRAAAGRAGGKQSGVNRRSKAEANEEATAKQVASGASNPGPYPSPLVTDDPPKSPTEIDEIELLCDDLLAPGKATPKQLRAIAGFARLVGRPRTIEVLKGFRGPDFEDGFSGAFEQLRDEADHAKLNGRKPSEWAYLDEESAADVA